MSPTTQQLEHAVRQSTDERAQVDAMVALARSLSSAETRRAVDVALEAVALADRIDYLQGAIRARVRAAVCLDLLGEYDRAQEILITALESSSKLPDSVDTAYLYKQLGLVRARRGHFQEAFEHFDRAIGMAQGNDALIADLTICRAIVHRRTGQLTEALEGFETALAILEKIGGEEGISIVLSNMGNVYGERGQFAKALECFYRSHAIAEKTGDQRALESALQGIGISCYYVGDNANALDYLARALRLSELLGHSEMAASSANNLGMVYLRMRHYASALKYYMLSLSIRQAAGDIRGEAFVIANIGEFYETIDDLEQAIEYFRRALALRRSLLYHPGEAGTLETLGRLLLRAGQTDEAIVSLQQGLGIAERTEPRDARLELALHRHLVQAFDTTGDRRQKERHHKAVQKLEKVATPPDAEGDVQNMILKFEATQALRTAAGLTGSQREIASHAIRRITELASRSEAATPAERTPEIVVTTLGRFSVAVGGRELTQEQWKRKRARDIFKILLIHHGRSVGADELLDLLQGDRGEIPSRATLWNAVSAIKSAFEPGLRARAASRFLSTTDGSYQLDLGSDTQIDFLLFRRKIEEARATDSPDARISLLEEAVGLYSGDFLKEDLYEGWATETRESLRDAYIEALMELATEAFEEKQNARAIGFLRRVLEADRTYEEAYRMLMQHYRQSRLEAEQEKLRQRCHKEFQRETGAPPPSWLLRLMESPAVSSR
jgi:tetratricopeptide (TPR) repeat protein/two-component SAPR family response regulator